MQTTKRTNFGKQPSDHPLSAPDAWLAISVNDSEAELLRGGTQRHECFGDAFVRTGKRGHYKRGVFSLKGVS